MATMKYHLYRHSPWEKSTIQRKKHEPSNVCGAYIETHNDVVHRETTRLVEKDKRRGKKIKRRCRVPPSYRVARRAESATSLRENAMYHFPMSDAEKSTPTNKRQNGPTIQATLWS